MSKLYAKFYSEDEDFGTLCICAVRYAIGRATYMPGLVAGIVGRHLSDLTIKDLAVIMRDIEESGFGGDAINAADWARLYTKVKNEYTERKGGN